MERKQMECDYSQYLGPDYKKEP
jgi:hypothetical protein